MKTICSKLNLSLFFLICSNLCLIGQDEAKRIPITFAFVDPSLESGVAEFSAIPGEFLIESRIIRASDLRDFIIKLVDDQVVSYVRLVADVNNDKNVICQSIVTWLQACSGLPYQIELSQEVNGSIERERVQFFTNLMSSEILRISDWNNILWENQDHTNALSLQESLERINERRKIDAKLHEYIFEINLPALCGDDLNQFYALIKELNALPNLRYSVIIVQDSPAP